ncbi:MAG: BACON domain-containing protein, partial [Clostridia bacterium]|nr:BACON domain-containing protein [Clostridia bacterium]
MKVRTLILGLMLSVFLSACQEEEILGPASLKSIVEKVELSVDGDTQTFSIKATRDWTATVSPQDSGFEIYPLSGKGSNNPQTITVKAEGNTGRIRSAVLTFTAAGVNPLTIRISQEGKLGDIYPVSEIRKLGAGAALPSAKLRVQLLSDLSLGNVAQKNLYVQDNTGGIQIRLASYHEFAQGDSLLIDLEGSQLSHFNGLLQIPVDNDKVTCFYTGKPVVAKPVSVKDFMDSKYEGQYISLNAPCCRRK